MKRAMSLPVMLSLASCTPLPPVTPKAALPIEGAWKSDCLPIGRNGRHGFITRLDVSGMAIVATTQIYAHSNCDLPTVSTRYEGVMVGFRVTADGAVDFEQKVRSITMTPDHPEVVAIYNATPESGCGFSGGWVLGVTRGVEGRFCAPFLYPAAGTTLYERAWVSGDDLRIGSFPAVWTNTSADKRPTAPGPLVFHRFTGREK